VLFLHAESCRALLMIPLLSSTSCWQEVDDDTTCSSMLMMAGQINVSGHSRLGHSGNTGCWNWNETGWSPVRVFLQVLLAQPPHLFHTHSLLWKHMLRVAVCSVKEHCVACHKALQVWALLHAAAASEVTTVDVFLPSRYLESVECRFAPAHGFHALVCPPVHLATAQDKYSNGR
jgi:hypothetical protein